MMNDNIMHAFMDEMLKVAYDQDPRVRLMIALNPELVKDAAFGGRAWKTVSGLLRKKPLRAKVMSVTDPRTMVTSTAKGARKSITPKKLISAKKPKPPTGPWDTPEIRRLEARGF